MREYRNLKCKNKCPNHQWNLTLIIQNSDQWFKLQSCENMSLNPSISSLKEKPFVAAKTAHKGEIQTCFKGFLLFKMPL